MSKPTLTINKIKALLGIEVKLETMALDNGTIIEAEMFEAGQPVFIVTPEDERVALPVGEYTLEDGRALVVSEEGVIGEITDAQPAAEEEPAVEVEVEAAEEAPNYVTREELEAALGEIKAMFAQVAKPAELAEETKPEGEKVEMSAQEEAPMPAAKPIKANPEREAQKGKTILYAQERPMSTNDIVMAKVAQLSNN